MKRLQFLCLILALVLGVMPAFAGSPVTKNYGDVSLTGGFESGNFPLIWDLTACDLVLNFTVDLTGMIDEFGGSAHAWSELGVRDTSTTSNFNPGTWLTGGKGVWLATDYDWAVNTFAPDPVGGSTQDIDDKLILQQGGGAGEGSYDLPSSPSNPWANYGVWFDRDGVDQWQALIWGMIDGATYNTGGTYDVEIMLHTTSATTGTAFMTVNGVQQGFYSTWQNAAPQTYPAGMTFSGDMAHMQVFYGLYGYGATHTVLFEDITGTGCLPTIVIGGCDTGVNDRLFSDNSSVYEKILECAAGTGNHGKFVSCVSQLTNDAKKGGIITGQEKGAIQSCAAQANIP